MNITKAVENRRSDTEPRRASTKSGSVYAPDRRSGAATSSMSVRYPAVKPIGYQSASAPSFSTTPATARKDAADRYSPEIAAALRRDRTVRRATRKSFVVTANRDER